MPVTYASGTDNLRADQNTHRSAEPASPSTAGSDVGGTPNLRAKTQILRRPDPAAPVAGGPDEGGKSASAQIHSEHGS